LVVGKTVEPDAAFVRVAEDLAFVPVWREAGRRCSPAAIPSSSASGNATQLGDPAVVAVVIGAAPVLIAVLAPAVTR
jgi:hypothetical protein